MELINQGGKEILRVLSVFNSNIKMAGWVKKKKRLVSNGGLAKFDECNF